LFESKQGKVNGKRDDADAKGLSKARPRGNDAWGQQLVSERIRVVKTNEKGHELNRSGNVAWGERNIEDTGNHIRRRGGLIGTLGGSKTVRIKEEKEH